MRTSTKKSSLTDEVVLTPEMKDTLRKKIEYHPSLGRYGGLMTPSEIIYLSDKVIHGPTSQVAVEFAKKHRDQGKSKTKWFFFKEFKPGEEL